jgi:hypothetical protein
MVWSSSGQNVPKLIRSTFISRPVPYTSTARGSAPPRGPGGGTRSPPAPSAAPPSLSRDPGRYRQQRRQPDPDPPGVQRASQLHPQRPPHSELSELPVHLADRGNHWLGSTPAREHSSSAASVTVTPANSRARRPPRPARTPVRRALGRATAAVPEPARADRSGVACRMRSFVAVVVAWCFRRENSGRSMTTAGPRGCPRCVKLPLRFICGNRCFKNSASSNYGHRT